MAFTQDYNLHDTMFTSEFDNPNGLVDFDSFINFQDDELDLSAPDSATYTLPLQIPPSSSLHAVSGPSDLSLPNPIITPSSAQSTSPDSSSNRSVSTSPQTSLLDSFDGTCEMPQIADAELTAIDPFFDDINQWLPYVSSTIRDIAHARAHTDKGSASMKTKRRDAAIALYLERQYESDLQMATSMSQSSFDDFICGPESFSVTQSPQSPYESTNSPSSIYTSSSSRPGPRVTISHTRALEMVLDLNMNATTQLPRKQKPRTKAQIEDYINVRRNGACIKHKKQHKKCTCLNKLSSVIGSDVKSTRQQERIQTPVTKPILSESGISYVRLPDLRRSELPVVSQLVGLDNCQSLPGVDLKFPASRFTCSGSSPSALERPLNFVSAGSSSSPSLGDPGARFIYSWPQCIPPLTINSSDSPTKSTITSEAHRSGSGTQLSPGLQSMDASQTYLRWLPPSPQMIPTQYRCPYVMSTSGLRLSGPTTSLAGNCNRRNLFERHAKFVTEELRPKLVQTLALSPNISINDTRREALCIINVIEKNPLRKNSISNHSMGVSMRKDFLDLANMAVVHMRLLRTITTIAILISNTVCVNLLSDFFYIHKCYMQAVRLAVSIPYETRTHPGSMAIGWLV